MKSRLKCDKKITEETDVCRKCSCTQERKETKNDDGTGRGVWALLGFFIPVAGLILYLIWKEISI